MKKKLVLHIGPHRTGSSTFQALMFSNYIYLNSIGIEYPYIKSFCGNLIQHADLAQTACIWSRISSDVKTRYLKELEVIRAKEHIKCILLSSELFASCEDLICFIEDLCEEFNVYVLGCIRDPISHLISWWQFEEINLTGGAPLSPVEIIKINNFSQARVWNDLIHFDTVSIICMPYTKDVVSKLIDQIAYIIDTSIDLPIKSVHAANSSPAGNLLIYGGLVAREMLCKDLPRTIFSHNISALADRIGPPCKGIPYFNLNEYDELQDILSNDYEALNCLSIGIEQFKLNPLSYSEFHSLCQHPSPAQIRNDFKKFTSHFNQLMTKNDINNDNFYSIIKYFK